MLALRALLTAVALVPMAGIAQAQPVDPYNPAPSSEAKPPASEAKPPAPAPAPDAPKPAPDASKPGPDAAKPGPDAAKPGPDAAKPGPDAAKPRPDAAKPAPDAAKPAPDAAKPAPAPAAPADPYATGPSAAAPDLPMPERVAQALVARAQELLDARAYLDAKQLAVEALVGSPRGPAAEHARAIIHSCNLQLGIQEDTPKPLVKPDEDVDTSPIGAPPVQPETIVPPPEGGPPSGRLPPLVHGGLYGGLLGATIGSLFSSDSPAKGAVPVGLAFGAAGGFVAPRLVDRYGMSEAQVRIVGSASVWGGVVGGLFGDISKTHDTSAREVLVPASITATLAGLGAYTMSRTSKLTRGDVALIDTFAGIGALGGITVGMIMQPVETEAYSLNAVLGIAGGVTAGVLLAPITNTTPRRMVRVAGLAAIGGAAPFLLYAGIQSSSSTADERVTGILSTVGLAAGALLGFRWTRGMDAGLDTLDGKPRQRDDAPVALVGRSSDGSWGLGGVGFAPLSRALAPQPGMALQLVGATF
jgi:hypothetical protein